MNRINTAVIGTGFMGRVHLEALRRVEFVNVAAVVGTSATSAEKLGAPFGIPSAVANEVLEDCSIHAIHICTPNAQHFAMAKSALLAGKHVLCEKPLAITTAEAKELIALASRQQLRACVCHNLRFYPMLHQMRGMREAGELGEILSVQGFYSQDWLLYDTDWNWRVDSSSAGPSRCMADIGSHWFDAAEHVTGMRVTSLCADLQTFHRTRKKSRHSTETFAGTANVADYIETPVDTEDYGAVIFRMGERARGTMTASQVAAGRKNRFSIEIYGTKSSAAWNQERPNELWIGNRDNSNRIMLKDPSLLGPSARPFADLPGGHGEGYADTFKQLFRRFYNSIHHPSAPPEYPDFSDGLRQLVILDAVLKSNKDRTWINL